MKLKLRLYHLLLWGLCLPLPLLANDQAEDRKQIKSLLEQFQTNIRQKQKEQFLALFLHDSIPWVGVSDPASRAYSRKKYPGLGELEYGSCTGFIDFICQHKGPIDEKLFKPSIQLDSQLAVVVFDYSFWKDGAPQNWGKETWTLLKVQGQWKIAAVYYSGTLHVVSPTPKYLL